MAGKFMVVAKPSFEEGYDNFADADAEAKRQLAWRNRIYDNDQIYVVQQVALYDRPPVENAIVTTL